MTSGWNATRKMITGLLMAGVVTAFIPASAFAQSDESRLRKIEAELRALQRAVFPGGDGRYFTPEVDTTRPQPQQPVGSPSSTPLTDVLARLDALEAQLARLTARNEETANELSELQARFEASAAPQVPVEVPSGIIPVPAETGSDAAAAPSSSAAPAAPGPSAERLAAVQAIAKPQTDDAGDDEYTYGFRL